MFFPHDLIKIFVMHQKVCIFMFYLYLFIDDPHIRFSRAMDDNMNEKMLSDNKERYIETLVVVDQKMCNYHGEDAATQFTMAVLNMVSGSFYWLASSKHYYNIPRACLLDRSPVPAMVLKSNRSGLCYHMLETCRGLRLCRKRSNNVARHDKTPVK